ncbi:hypothetical protein [Micromonospora sp. S-DT3-3-22]|uniref:hypothetical protein n=1 Tax=Micromonospora sp. S-DT3-3-22 TaxID=2755359 RepID=UPI00188FBC44|nr:hypothetical protein [Micromonospora sp. S-DT3-3-22]
MKIFGREPALWLALIGAVLTWAAGLGLPFLSAGQAVAITTALTGVVIAVTTRPIAPGLYVAAVGMIAALFAEYGLHWSDAAVTGLGGIILAGFALFGIRPQVSPASEPARRSYPSSVGGGSAAVLALVVIALGVAALPAYAGPSPARPGEQANRPLPTAPSPSTLRCTTVTTVPGQIRLDRCTSDGVLVGYRPYMWDGVNGAWVQLATA